MRRWGQIAEAKSDEWYHEMAKKVYLPGVYEQAAAALIAEGKAQSGDFPAGTDGYRAPTRTSITSVSQQLAIATGVAVAALVLDLTRNMRGDLSLIAADFAPAFVFVAIVAMCSVFLFIGLPKNAGAALTARKELAVTAREPDAPG
jgi:hypothetical protein